MEVFVFPLLNVTLFPGMIKPLIVFEPRYLAMVRAAAITRTPIAIACVEDLREVGPVKPGQKIPFVRQIAGYGLVHLIEDRGNDTSLVFIQSEGKVRLGKVLPKDVPYIVCESEVIDENMELEVRAQKELLTLLKMLKQWVGLHIPDPEQRSMFMRSIQAPEEIVGGFASFLVRDNDAQQVILELNDLNEKIHFLNRLKLSA